jgi:aminomethyltransferase
VTTEAIRKTPLYEEHRRLGARLVPFAGWEMPVQFAGISAEHHAVRQRAGLFDVSHMGELELSGAGAATLVNRLVTNDLDRVADGQAMYTVCCNQQGGILDDLLVYKRTNSDILVVCNASNRDKIVPHFQNAASSAVQVRDTTFQTALLALQGPRALEVLVRAEPELAGIDRSLGSFRLRSAKIGGIDTTIARTGYTGEDGVEIFCPWDAAPALWRALLDAGRPVEIFPVGLGARDTLRLEARLSLYGSDIDETTNPIESGLGWTVKLDKPDFVGKHALEQIKQQGPRRRLAGFEMTGRGIARHGYPLLDATGRVVGVCTSGAPSPTLGKNIGLGYLPTALAEPSSEILVDCRGKSVPARIVKTPFYKRAKQS